MDMFNVFCITCVGFFLCLNGVECGSVGCYSEYQQCYTTYSQVPRPQALTDDWTSFCNAADTLDTCLKNHIVSCGSNDVASQAYTYYVAIASDSKKWCRDTACTKIQLNCSAEYVNTVSFKSQDSDVTPEDLSKICQALPAVKTCYSNFLQECNKPEMTTGISILIIESIDQQISSCQTSGECLVNYLRCVNVALEITASVSNITFGDPSAVLRQFGSVCPVFGRLKVCSNNLGTICPSFLNSSTDLVNSFQILEQSCSSDSVNCETKLQECMAPLSPYPQCTDLANLYRLSIPEGVNCCKLGKDTTKCLRDGGCGKKISSNPALQQSEALCRGYNDYCPEMFDCFNATYSNGPFNDPAALCRNIGDFLTCIEEKCANKPQIGRQSLAKIKEVFTGICQVVGKYPAVAVCKKFTSCLENSPSLPGTVNSIQSFVSARNSDRWCQIAKSYVSCGEKAAEGNSCNQGSPFATDVLNVQTVTDQACAGVRGPCLSGAGCLATLQGSQSEIMFKTTCPNIPSFVTCTETALSMCGEESRVKADYSLIDIKDLYGETCQAMNDGLYQCSFMATCLDLQLPTNTGDMIVEFSDQTSWCRKLNRMLKCTADVSISCQQPKSVHDKFMMLYHKVSKYCPSPDYQTPASSTTPDSTDGTDDGNRAGGIRVTGVLIMVTAFFLIFC